MHAVVGTGSLLHFPTRRSSDLSRTASSPVNAFGSTPARASITPAGTAFAGVMLALAGVLPDRKRTRLNSCHLGTSYAVFCLKKKKINTTATVNAIRE